MLFQGSSQPALSQSQDLSVSLQGLWDLAERSDNQGQPSDPHCIVPWLLYRALQSFTRQPKPRARALSAPNPAVWSVWDPPPASHQFLKSSGAAEEHLGTKPPYAWRPGGAGHALFWGPCVPDRPGDMGGRTRRRGASEGSIPCNAPQAKSLTVQILQAHGACCSHSAQTVWQ